MLTDVGLGRSEVAVEIWVVVVLGTVVLGIVEIWLENRVVDSVIDIVVFWGEDTRWASWETCTPKMEARHTRAMISSTTRATRYLILASLFGLKKEKLKG